MFSKLLFGADLPTWALFAEMVLAGMVVIFSGSRFTRLADTVADRLNLGGGLVGLVLLATVTSLPELVTGGTATWIGNVDLAFGNLFGSCSFNITLIVILNAVLGGSVLRQKVSSLHTLTSSFGVLLMAEALLGIILIRKFSPTPTGELVWVAVITVTYVMCIRLTYRHELLNNRTASGTAARQRVGGGVWAQIALMALILVIASWWLAQIGDVLSTHEIDLIGRPLGATFVGAVFLAISTSLPEIVTGVTAVRLGKLDLALGNIFGSNMFNIFVIPMLKVVSWTGGAPLLLPPDSVGGMDHVFAGLLAILLTTIAIGGLAYQSQSKPLRRFGFDSILIGVAYLGGMALLLIRSN